MVKENIIKNLTTKDDKYACALSDKIISESKETDEWYEYKDSMRPLIEKDMLETERILTDFLRKTSRIETNRLLLREIKETDVKEI